MRLLVTDLLVGMQRRLLIGGVLAAGALAFALVPTEALRPKPQRPLFFYVVPLLRVSNLLAEAQVGGCGLRVMLVSFMSRLSMI